MNIDKYLPLGSVVTLNDENYPEIEVIEFLIINRLVVVENELYDYVVVAAAEGVHAKSKISLIKISNIKEVLHTGFQNDGLALIFSHLVSHYEEEGYLEESE